MVPKTRLLEVVICKNRSYLKDRRQRTKECVAFFCALRS